MQPKRLTTTSCWGDAVRLEAADGGNYRRLAEVRQRYDQNLFRLNQNVRPEPRAT
jgi:hypothetical protein